MIIIINLIKDEVLEISEKVRKNQIWKNDELLEEVSNNNNVDRLLGIRKDD